MGASGARSCRNLKQIRLIEAKDHFFAGALEEFEEAIATL